jgi:glycosyltransferase involved in cell wall biosynthesis
MRASIAITSHNEGDLLWKTVQSCLETMQDLDCEIVVADDGSTDGSIEELIGKFDEVRVVTLPERRGCPAARDLAARSSQGDVLIFLDAHCKPEGEALIRLVDDVEQWNGQVIVAPRIVGLDVKRWESGPTSAYIGFRLDLEWFTGGWLKPEDLKKWVGPGGRVFYEESCMAGCSLAIARDLYEKLRGFDRDMLTWGMEDQDLALKCWLMGHSILVDPELAIGHRFVRTHSNYSIPFEHLLANRLRMARKNFDSVTWEDWCWRHRTFYGPRIWREAWRLFELNRESVEEEREYLLSVRPHGIYQYAIQFGLAWPLTLSNSPYPAPVVLERPRYFSPVHEATAQPSRTHGPPDHGPTTTHYPPDYPPPATHEPPDYGPTTTHLPPDYPPPATHEPPDYGPTTTHLPPDYPPPATHEPPDYSSHGSPGSDDDN